MDQKIIFDENAWSVIDSYIPNDAYIKKIVLEDFIWFIRKSSKRNNNKKIIQDYKHHLELKAHSKAISQLKIPNMEPFKLLEIDRIIEGLSDVYLQGV